jgi:hypothetical protein
MGTADAFNGLLFYIQFGASQILQRLLQKEVKRKGIPMLCRTMPLNVDWI